ncbi:MAG: methyltransferase domain-containing protein [Patescibacteria group bacterium]
MTQSIAVLGRQPALGIAELESLYGAEKLHPLGDQAALIDIDPAEISFSRLGGTIKLARLVTIIDSTDWKQVEQHLSESAAKHSTFLPDGKMSFGLSVYGLDVSPARINATALSVKKLIKATGRPVRVVPNKTPDLSSAQVLHNGLNGERAWELLFIRHGQQTYMAQTTNVQDITAYAARDQARPKRDARVGMLPPKLAQIIINLAVGQVEENEERRTENGEVGTVAVRHSSFLVPRSLTVLDPFCGTGVVLQEALLMGYKTYGTDLEPRMVEYSKTNLDWLSTVYRLPSTVYNLEAADATNHKWDRFDTIAAEAYLGRAFSALPRPEILREVMSDVNAIIKMFLQNVTRQTSPGFRMCIAVPAWKTAHSFAHLKLLDNLTDLGYTRAVFTHVASAELIYHRPEQIVARELVVLVRK